MCVCVQPIPERSQEWRVDRVSVVDVQVVPAAFSGKVVETQSEDRVGPGETHTHTHTAWCFYTLFTAHFPGAARVRLSSVSLLFGPYRGLKVP